MDAFASCPVCNITVPLSELQWHANNHFENEEEKQISIDKQLALQIASSLTNNDNQVSYHESQSPKGRGKGKSLIHIDDKSSCLAALQTRSSFYHVREGLIPLLKHCLESESKSQGSVCILSNHVDHFQSTVSEDVGWGCGWRNIQMLCSHLLMERQDAKRVLFGGCGFIPDLPSLQRWLEIAWEKGFDVVGSQHFNQKIYGTTNWIGTTECATLLRSFGLRARIVDFGPNELKSLYLSDPSSIIGTKRKPSQVHGPMDKYLLGRNPNLNENLTDSLGIESNEGHPNSLIRKTDQQQILMDWVWNYFSDEGITLSGTSSSQVIIRKKGPLYFQHEGHSRTIVGIQKDLRSGVHKHTLLIFDPATKTAAIEKVLKENVGWQKYVKRGVHTLKKPQYQLCYIDAGIAEGEELEQLKTIHSTFIEI